MPLFAMIVAEYLEAVESDAANRNLSPNLLQVVLKREAGRRRELIQDRDKLQRMENLLLLATLVSGLLPKANGFGYLAAGDVAGLLPAADLLDEESLQRPGRVGRREHVLRGTSARHSRRAVPTGTGHQAQAENFLNMAAEDPGAHQETLVDAVIVGAQILEDTGNMDAASEMWRKALAAPSATNDQVRTAKMRLDAIPPRKREPGCVR